VIVGFRSKIAKWFLKAIDVDDGLLGGAWDAVDWSTENFAALSREGYEHCATVYRCIDLVTKGMAGVLIGVFQETEEGPELIRGHPYISKMKRPNPLMSRSMYIRYWGTSMLLGGRAFQWANRSETTGDILEYWIIPPNDVNVVLGQQFGTIHSYDWTYNGQHYILQPEDVLYTWFPNPRDFMQHMSPLKAAAQEVDFTNEGLRWNLSLLMNGAKPSGWVGLDKDSTHQLSPEHVKQIKLALKNEYSGSKHAGKTPVFRLPGLQLNSWGWNPQDMDWLKGLDTADIRIANVFAVPPELVGAQKTYENFSVAQRVLYEGAILPLMNLFTDELTNWPAIGLMEDEFLQVLWERIKALQDDQNALSMRIGGEVDRGIITRNEARKALQYPESDDPMADVLTVTKEVASLAASPFNIGTEES